MSYIPSFFFSRDRVLVSFHKAYYDLDLKKSLKSSCTHKWGFWEVTGLWGDTANLLLRGRAWLEDVGHWTHDLESCLSLLNSSLFISSLPLRWGAFLYPGSFPIPFYFWSQKLTKSMSQNKPLLH